MFEGKFWKEISGLVEISEALKKTACSDFPKKRQNVTFASDKKFAIFDIKSAYKGS